MIRSFALSVALGIGASAACTIIPTAVRYDTVSPGTVVLTVASSDTGDADGRDTLRVVRDTEMRAHVEALFTDSALVFIGRIDSTITIPLDSDSVPDLGSTPLELSTEWDTIGGAGSLYMRVRVDTLVRGTLPGASFWVHAHASFSTCDTFYPMDRAFLNASGGLTRLSDIKVDITETGYNPPPPRAHWFDGRYLVSPDFPGLRLDITALYPDYPATSVQRRAASAVPLRPDGRAYRPDGRVVPEGAGADRNSPVPLLR